ncbi:MAG: DUF494 domain-containing protein [Betaproteobacteria bacterium]|nr:DUF494 domain-containing protein [Betaproteobacteria bacterium]
MFDVLVYLFENYYQAQGCPDHDTLARKLHAAGFENDDIHDALDWLTGLAQLRKDGLTEALEASSAIRSYTRDEAAKISTESRGFIAFLESAGVLSPLLRELILERAMALSAEHVGLEKLKVIALMVLWTRRGNVDALVLDELLPEGESRQVH